MRRLRPWDIEDIWLKGLMLNVQRIALETNGNPNYSQGIHALADELAGRNPDFDRAHFFTLAKIEDLGPQGTIEGTETQKTANFSQTMQD